MAIKTEEIPVPLFGANSKELAKYKIRYLKVDTDDPGQVAELEIIETKGIQGDGDIVIISMDKFTFMAKYFIVMKYMEKISE